MGSGFSKMKKQARVMQEQMSKMQDELKQMEITGSAGNGLVKVVMNGEKEVQNITIDPSCVDPEDIEGLQDLIIGAIEDAYKKVEEKSPSGGELGGLSSLFGM